ncbi:MAG: hypothetical protein KC620_00235 [Myxococcales bacterium]|nr:hypothetical protein [Myxococcales bacterium]
MPITVYKIFHLTGMVMVFLSLGALAVHGAVRDERTGAWRKPALMTHGIGLLLVLVGGFGALARLGISWPWPGWIFAKIAIWLFFGAAATLVMRKPAMAKGLWWLFVLIFAAAAWLALYKPF